MKVGVIGAGTMGQGIAKAFAMVDGYEVALCDIKQEWAEGGKDKIAKGYARLVEKGKMTQEKVQIVTLSLRLLSRTWKLRRQHSQSLTRSASQSVSLLQTHQAFQSQRLEMALHVQ